MSTDDAPRLPMGVSPTGADTRAALRWVAENLTDANRKACAELLGVCAEAMRSGLGCVVGLALLDDLEGVEGVEDEDA
jgi:hypothetical protein